jgi:hypothetical protein
VAAGLLESLQNEILCCRAFGYTLASDAATYILEGKLETNNTEESNTWHLQYYIDICKCTASTRKIGARGAVEKVSRFLMIYMNTSMSDKWVAPSSTSLGVFKLFEMNAIHHILLFSFLNVNMNTTIN